MKPRAKKCHSFDIVHISVDFHSVSYGSLYMPGSRKPTNYLTNFSEILWKPFCFFFKKFQPQLVINPALNSCVYPVTIIALLTKACLGLSEWIFSLWFAVGQLLKGLVAPLSDCLSAKFSGIRQKPSSGDWEPEPSWSLAAGPWSPTAFPHHHSTRKHFILRSHSHSSRQTPWLGLTHSFALFAWGLGSLNVWAWTKGLLPWFQNLFYPFIWICWNRGIGVL